MYQSNRRNESVNKTLNINNNKHIKEKENTYYDYY
ncbi:MAG: hypothetical protein K0R54_5445, partial [Clostridiaceae bacterium]|nr:hypothetical protein [Clostridiaceae bacterium]